MLALPGAALLTVPLAAQAPSTRVALAAWNDSLLRITTVAALHSVAPRSRQSSGAQGDLRLVEYQLRQVELHHDNTVLQLALVRLDLVAAAHRDWPLPEVLMSRTFFALSDSGAPMKLAAGLREGELYEEAAWRHLRDAIDIDPACAEARALALQVLVPEGDRELRSDERHVLARLRSTRHPEASLLLVAGRDFRTQRHYDSALVMFDSAAALGADRGAVDLDRAHTLSALGDSAAAARAYWDGLDHVTPATREAYRYDLAWMMPPDTLAQYDGVPDDSVAPWMRRFWARRDAEAANLPGQRLQEQLRRWTYAFEHFRVAIPWRHTQFNRVEYGFEGLDACVSNDTGLYDLLAREQPSHPNDARHREPLLDHRGLIYLHHGEPVRRVYGPGTAFGSDLLADTMLSAPTSGADLGKPTQDPTDSTLPAYCIRNSRDTRAGWLAGPNEAWLYWIDGSWRVLNFRGSCALGTYSATTLTSYLPVSGFTVGDWLARAGLTPAYHDAAMQIYSYRGFQPLTCVPQVNQAIAVGRTDADVATRTDSHTPYIARPWNAVVQAFALGSGSDGSGEALVTFAIPIDSLTPQQSASGVPNYALTARLVAYDRLSGMTFAIDTVRHFLPPTGGGHHGSLVGWFEFALRPGDWELGVRMNQGVDSIGTYALAPHLRVAAGGALSMSDIVTGTAAGLAWPAPDGSAFPLNVLGAWTAGSNAELYFEVRGLAADAEYRSVVEVRDPADPRKDLVRLEFADHATGPTTTVRKTLGLAQLKPGDFQLVVTVTSGVKTVSREQRILVLKGK
jgi:hypothetical protein